MSFSTFSIAYFVALFSPLAGLAGLAGLAAKVTVFCCTQGAGGSKPLARRRTARLLAIALGASAASWAAGAILSAAVLPQAWFGWRAPLVVYFGFAAALSVAVELAVLLPVRRRLRLRRVWAGTAAGNGAGYGAMALMIAALHGPDELLRLG